MIRVIDVHDMDLLESTKLIRSLIEEKSKGILVIIHGYGSTSNQFKKLTEIRNIGRSRVKKGQLVISISGPELNDPLNRIKFTSDELSKLNSYIVNSGVTIMKK